MADTYYDVGSNPQYNDKVRKLQNTDPANAETVFNPTLGAMVENEAYLKEEVESLSDSKVNKTGDTITGRLSIDGEFYVDESNGAGINVSKGDVMISTPNAVDIYGYESNLHLSGMSELSSSGSVTIESANSRVNINSETGVYIDGTPFESVATSEDLDDVNNRVTEVENNKVDKIDGKGLSANDYTTAEKNKLAEFQGDFRYVKFLKSTDATAELLNDPTINYNYYAFTSNGADNLGLPSGLGVVTWWHIEYHAYASVGYSTQLAYPYGANFIYMRSSNAIKWTDWVEVASPKIGEIDNKVDKVDGKGLSTNDFTNAEKSKLSEFGSSASYMKRYGLNSVNIDSTEKNFITNVSADKITGTQDSTGTPPSSWSNVMQFTADHFYTQLANDCATTPSSKCYLHTRFKYTNRDWSDWRKLAFDADKLNVTGGTVTGNLTVGSGGLVVGTKAGTLGSQAFAQGSSCTASGNYSHAGGYFTAASETACHAEGYKTTASGAYGAHAEGSDTVASGMRSHGEGYGTKAKGNASHAEGYLTESIGEFSNAGGAITTAASYCEHVCGRCNVVSTTSGSGFNSTANAFVIGNGSSESSRSNAFRVTFNGKVYGLSAFNSTGADYAEFFEWLDGNPNNEDRIGCFVTLEGEKVRIANENDDYILGVVSTNPAIIGNNYGDVWQGMYLTDEFGRILYEEVDVEREVEIIHHEEIVEDITEIDEDGEETVVPTVVQEAYDEEIEIRPAGTELRMKINPNYNSSEEYIPREQRKEWGIIGLMGQLMVYTDGTCEVNGYCKIGADGKATKAVREEGGYRVLSIVNDNLIKILFK